MKKTNPAEGNKDQHSPPTATNHSGTGTYQLTEKRGGGSCFRF